MGLGGGGMKRKSVSLSLILTLVALTVLASAVPALASRSSSSSVSGVSASFSTYIPGALFFSLKSLKHDRWDDKDKWGTCGGREKPCAVPEEPALIQMACLLALFALAIPTVGLVRRKLPS